MPIEEPIVVTEPKEKVVNMPTVDDVKRLIADALKDALDVRVLNASSLTEDKINANTENKTIELDVSSLFDDDDIKARDFFDGGIIVVEYINNYPMKVFAIGFLEDVPNFVDFHNYYDVGVDKVLNIYVINGLKNIARKGTLEE